MKNATHLYYNDVDPFPANVQVIEPNVRTFVVDNTRRL